MLKQKSISTILFLIIFFNQSIAQNMNFEKQWQAVTKLENVGKTKDALKAVEDIIQDARKDKNANQIVKASLYKYKYMMTLEEDSELKIVNEIKQNINLSSGTEKAVLQSILAELYFQYFNDNSWKFSNRTETDEKQSDDFRTWDLKTLFKEINSYYIASLENKELLQQTKLH